MGPTVGIVPCLSGTLGTIRAEAFTIGCSSEPTRRLGRSETVRTHVQLGKKCVNCPHLPNLAMYRTCNFDQFARSLPTVATL